MNIHGSAELNTSHKRSVCRLHRAQTYRPKNNIYPEFENIFIITSASLAQVLSLVVLSLEKNDSVYMFMIICLLKVREF